MYNNLVKHDDLAAPPQHHALPQRSVTLGSWKYSLNCKPFWAPGESDVSRRIPPPRALHAPADDSRLIRGVKTTFLHTGLIMLVEDMNENTGEQRTEAVPMSGRGSARRQRFRSLLSDGSVGFPFLPCGLVLIQSVLRQSPQYWGPVLHISHYRHVTRPPQHWLEDALPPLRGGGGAAEHKLVPGLGQKFVFIYV